MTGFSPFQFRPQLETYEDRLAPAMLTFALPSVPPALVAKAAPTLGQTMATYLQGELGKRVGGGECAHVATAALRAAGADFTRTEAAGTLDYVWTSNRVARLTHGNQLAGKVFQAGDIIQYHNATFSSGGSGKLAHHTQVVAAVDSAGRITKVFEQNYDHIRTLARHDILNLSKLNGGSVSIYRPVARTTQAGRIEFTLVNNTSTAVTPSVVIGSKSLFNVPLTSVDTTASYSTPTVTYSGSTTPSLKIGNVTVTLTDGAAYEVYRMANGQTGVRRL